MFCCTRKMFQMTQNEFKKKCYERSESSINAIDTKTAPSHVLTLPFHSTVITQIPVSQTTKLLHI